MRAFGKYDPLSTNTLGKLNRACRHIGFGVDMDVQTAGGITDIADDDRFRRANHAIEPHLVALHEPTFGIKYIAC